MEERSYRDLPAWQRAMDFALAVYRVTDGWPDAEREGLTAQLRSDAVRVPAKIAAGSVAFESDEPTAQAALAKELFVARRALREADIRLDIAEGLGYGDAATIERLREDAAEVRRLLDELIERLPEPEVEIDPFDIPFSDN